MLACSRQYARLEITTETPSVKSHVCLMIGVRAALVLAACFLLVPAGGGCMMFCPEPSPKRMTRTGEVKLLDYGTCRRMRVLEHGVERNHQGQLVVRITWLNVTRKPYRARIRVAFFGENRLGERGAFRWDVHRFPPGKQALEWTSYSKDAVRYRIEVRSAM